MVGMSPVVPMLDFEHDRDLLAPAELTCTRRGARGSGSTALMEATGRLNWPGLKCGFSWPSYSNLRAQHRMHQCVTVI